MCEIFSIRGNKKGIEFELGAFSSARASNSDGAGYVIFEKDRYNRFDVVHFETFGPKPEPSYRYSEHYSYMGEDSVEDSALQFLEDFDQTSPVARAYVRNKKKKAKKEKKASLPVVHSYPGHSYYTSEVDTIPGIFYSAQKMLKPNQLMVAHFRFATSGGVTHENTHPIISGDYLVIHNGVFGYETLPPEMSDTRLFANVLHKTSKREKADTPKKEQRLIARLLKNAGGYYSVFVYSWKTKTLYYFKDTTASFSIDQSGLLGATRDARFPIVTLPPKNGIVR